jgi:hypothetical protein
MEGSAGMKHKAKKKKIRPWWRTHNSLEARTLQYHIECCRNEIITLRSEVNSLRAEIMAMKELAKQRRDRAPNQLKRKQSLKDKS